MEPAIAHAEQSRSKTAHHPPQQFHGACRNCRRRKVRCDHGAPCLKCINRNEVCQYEVIAISKRRTRGLGQRRDMRELWNKINKLEAVVDSYNNDKDKASFVDFARKAIPTEGDQVQVGNVAVPALFKKHAGLVTEEGTSAYTTDSLFAELTNQMKDMHIFFGKDDLVGDSKRQNQIHSNSTAPVAQSFFPGLSFLSPGPQGALLIQPAEVLVLWQVYLRNVDSIMKLIHVPSIQLVINQVGHHQTSQPANIEALLSAIYLAAIVSLTDDEIYSILGKRRSQLLPLYKNKVEEALAKANLLDTKHLTTLQAFVLLISTSRRSMSAQCIWTLTGTAIRIAKVLGLHRDGENFRLSQVDCELRRRLWWQIYYLDVKASEECGCDVSISEGPFDTRLPSNINDEDIHAGSTEQPIEQTGLTDMTLTLVRYELIPTEIMLQSKSKMSCLDEDQILHCEDLLRAKCESINAKYLRASGSQNHPHIKIAATLVDVVAKKISLKLNLGLVYKRESRSPSQETQDMLFRKSLDLVKLSNYLETDSSFKSWAWQTRRNVQWHAVVYLLLQLCERPPTTITESAWEALDFVFDKDTETLLKNEGGIHSQLILRFWERAKRHRPSLLSDTYIGGQTSISEAASSTSTGTAADLDFPNELDIQWSWDMLNYPVGFGIGTTMSWDVPRDVQPDSWWIGSENWNS